MFSRVILCVGNFVHFCYLCSRAYDDRLVIGDIHFNSAAFTARGAMCVAIAVQAFDNGILAGLVQLDYLLFIFNGYIAIKYLLFGYVAITGCLQ